MVQRLEISLVSLVAVAVGLSGCGSGDGLVPVHGKVFYKGQPLTHGTIVFTPDTSHGTSGPLASAEIQADGTYRLTSGAAAGAIAGWHRVTVLSVEPREGNGPRFTVPRSLLPEKYRDPVQSGLTCEIKPGKENGINFNLE
jgi:hypothetical protein